MAGSEGQEEGAINTKPKGRRKLEGWKLIVAPLLVAVCGGSFVVCLSWYIARELADRYTYPLYCFADRNIQSQNNGDYYLVETVVYIVNMGEEKQSGEVKVLNIVANGASKNQAAITFEDREANEVGEIKKHVSSAGEKRWLAWEWPPESAKGRTQINIKPEKTNSDKAFMVVDITKIPPKSFTRIVVWHSSEVEPEEVQIDYRGR